MGDVRVRITAVKDRSFDTVFRSIEDQAKRASTALASTGDKGGTALARGTKKGASEAERAIRDLEREMKGIPKVMDAGARAAADFGKEASRSFAATKREFDSMARDVERGLDKMSRAQRTFVDSRGRTRDASGRFVGGGGGGFGGGSRGGFGLGGGPMMAGRAALRIGREIAMGAGIDTDLSSIIAKNIELESRAVALSNAGYMPGKGGANGQRVRAGALQSQAFDVGRSSSFSPTEILKGLEAFTAKTGDLQSGREAIGDLAKLAMATNTEIEHMVDAAGDASNALGDIPNKGAAIVSVMTSVAAQGKLGAVEIRHLAREMAKVQAAASGFTGDAKQNMAAMGALAQMARAKGGAASAAEAATSVSAFANTFTKNARRKAFAKWGVGLDGADGKLRDPKSIILDALRATKGNTVGMGEMFMDVRARKAVGGFESVYRDAGGGEAGLEAVRRRFDELAQATMQAEETMASYSAVMQTQKSGAERFNTEIQSIVARMQTELGPALASLAPQVIAATKSFADVIGKLFPNADVDANTAKNAADIEKQLNAQKGGGYVYDKTLEAAGASEQSAKEELARAREGLTRMGENLPTGDVVADATKNDKDMLLGTLLGTSKGRSWNPETNRKNRQEDQKAEYEAKKAALEKAEHATAQLGISRQIIQEAVERGVQLGLSGGIEVRKLPNTPTTPKAPPAQSEPEH